MTIGDVTVSNTEDVMDQIWIKFGSHHFLPKQLWHGGIQQKTLIYGFWRRINSNILCNKHFVSHVEAFSSSGGFPGGGVLDISLGGEVRRGPSYPDPV